MGLSELRETSLRETEVVSVILCSELSNSAEIFPSDPYGVLDCWQCGMHAYFADKYPANAITQWAGKVPLILYTSAISHFLSHSDTLEHERRLLLKGVINQMEKRQSQVSILS